MTIHATFIDGPWHGEYRQLPAALPTVEVPVMKDDARVGFLVDKGLLHPDDPVLVKVEHYDRCIFRRPREGRNGQHSRYLYFHRETEW